jgi:hypothetical protein
MSLVGKAYSSHALVYQIQVQDQINAQSLIKDGKLSGTDLWQTMVSWGKSDLS